MAIFPVDIFDVLLSKCFGNYFFHILLDILFLIAPRMRKNPLLPRSVFIVELDDVPASSGLASIQSVIHNHSHFFIPSIRAAINPCSVNRSSWSTLNFTGRACLLLVG